MTYLWYFHGNSLDLCFSDNNKLKSINMLSNVWWLWLAYANSSRLTFLFLLCRSTTSPSTTPSGSIRTKSLNWKTSAEWYNRFHHSLQTKNWILKCQLYTVLIYLELCFFTFTFLCLSSPLLLQKAWDEVLLQRWWFKVNTGVIKKVGIQSTWSCSSYCMSFC